MARVEVPPSPSREVTDAALRHAGAGEFVGLRALIDGIPDRPVFRAWFVAGTLGYVEISRTGHAYLAGIWRDRLDGGEGDGE